MDDTKRLELIAEAENPMKAISWIHSGTIDIIFLDINMPKMNGVDFIKHLKIDAAIIITTAYSDYAVDAYTLDVLDYLVKPISFERFLKACNKASEVINSKRTSSMADNKNDHFFIKCDNQIERVFYHDLLYAEAMLNYVMLYTHSKKMMVYMTIKSLEEQLPSTLFIKVHKSFIVNMSKVKSIEGNVLDVGTAKITISQNLREKVLNEILKGKIIKR